MMDAHSKKKNQTIKKYVQLKVIFWNLNQQLHSPEAMPFNSF